MWLDLWRRDCVHEAIPRCAGAALRPLALVSCVCWAALLLILSGLGPGSGVRAR